MPQTLLSKEDQAAVEAAVADAESRTSAQIVVALTARSGRYHRAADWFGLAIALIAVGAAWRLWQSLGPAPEDWESGVRPTLGLAWVLLIFGVWFVIGSAAATRWPALARPFITRDERAASVRRSGFEAFHKLRIARTRNAMGVLMYVSIFERTVWVCPDDGIAAKLGDSAWKPVSDLIAGGFRTGRPGPAMAAAVQKAGQLLAGPFPRSQEDSNELSDAVRIIPERRDGA
jgi:putative membrane protein